MNGAQRPTPELRQWINAQLAAGHAPAAVLKSMVASGWVEAVAKAALDEITRSKLVLRERGATTSQQPAKVPEPMDADGALPATDLPVRVLASLRNPRVVVFGGLVSDDECEEMIALSRTRLVRSETVQLQTGGSEVNAARTSDGMFFDRGEHPVCARIEERIAKLLSWPLENGEGLQVLRYRPGAEYKPHYDYFDPEQAGTAPVLKRGGQRVATLVMYLNTPEGGGATVFPDVGLDVGAVRGNAVFFSYDRPHPMTRSLHGGAPVIAGEKWVATKWLREGRFD